MDVSSPPIALIGMPGSGKSTIGKSIAKRFGFRHVDMDAYIEQEVGLSISEIFMQRGEQEFRKLEASSLKMLVNETKLVISTGGGAVVFKESQTLLKNHCYCVYLRASISTLHSRLKSDTKRPLLQAGNPLTIITNLFEIRHPLYEDTASAVIDATQSSASSLANQVMKGYQEWVSHSPHNLQS